MKIEKDHLDITELPSLLGWYKHGRDMGATHLIVATDAGEPFQPYFAMPDENVVDVESRLQGGGHIFETYELSAPLKQSQLDEFYRWVR